MGDALARLHGGTYSTSHWTPEHGQPSGDGTLSISGRDYRCEFKAESFPSPNVCFETNGAGNRDSGLTLAARQVDVWGHYHAGTDTLFVAKPGPLLTFAEEHEGQSGIWFCPAMGDGKRAKGYIVPVSLITGQPFVRTYANFSGSNWTGMYSLTFD